MEKSYSPELFETKIYQNWLDKNYFTTKPDGREHYSIVMPPPNVTGKAHIGHALDNTMQDILIRTKRMQGFNTLWVPGTDHAAIATEQVLVKDLKSKGLDKETVGREEFLKLGWQWYDKYANVICDQLKKLGISCDWSRQAFTMDENLNRAVRHVFCQYYKEGLIYKGKRVVNYCPSCKTTISDNENVHIDQSTFLWYIKYPFADGSGSVVVATTRPETIFGDTAVAVNPNDKRFSDKIGKDLILPLVNKKIKLIADDYCEMGFGTGAVKITPAHDPNDYEIGLRHNLDVVNCIDDDGKLTESAGVFAGLDFVPVANLSAAHFLYMDTVSDVNDTADTYRPVLEQAAALGLPFVCAGNDTSCFKDGKICLAPGALAEQYAVMGGRIVTLGKPDINIFKYCLDGIADPGSILVIGDNVATDIKGAVMLGWDSVLISKGVHVNFLGEGYIPDVAKTRELSNSYDASPDYVISNLRW